MEFTDNKGAGGLANSSLGFAGFSFFITLLLDQSQECTAWFEPVFCGLISGPNRLTQPCLGPDLVLHFETGA
jgi:hypothetical protein